MLVSVVSANRCERRVVISPDHVIGKLKELPGLGVFEECYRRTKTGGTQDVLVSIFDAGPAVTYPRYSATATTPDGRKAAGNPADSIDVALATLHWYELDKPPIGSEE